MNNQFILQGMEKFSFEVSEPYSAPHSLIFSLIAARCRAVDPEGGCGELVFTDEREFRSMAGDFQQVYLFDPHPLSRAGFIAMVNDYLHQYPDKRIERFVEFVSLPENQPRIEFFGSINSSLAKNNGVKISVKMRRKKMAEQSRRKNRK